MNKKKEIIEIVNLKTNRIEINGNVLKSQSYTQWIKIEDRISIIQTKLTKGIIKFILC